MTIAEFFGMSPTFLHTRAHHRQKKPALPVADLA